MGRLALALLLAPLWVPSSMTLLSTFFWFPPDFMGEIDKGTWIGLSAAGGALIGYAGIFAFGLLTHIVLKKRSSGSAWVYLATWFTVALMIWLVIFIADSARYGLKFALSYLSETIVHRPYVPLSIGMIWALVRATFWAIVRPDREEHSW